MGLTWFWLGAYNNICSHENRIKCRGGKEKIENLSEFLPYIFSYLYPFKAPHLSSQVSRWKQEFGTYFVNTKCCAVQGCSSAPCGDPVRFSLPGSSRNQGVTGHVLVWWQMPPLSLSMATAAANHTYKVTTWVSPSMKCCSIKALKIMHCRLNSFNDKTPSKCA